MTVNIPIEEYDLLLSFKEQLERKTQEYRHILKEQEQKEKEVIELIDFYNKERTKNTKQLNKIQEEIIKSIDILDALKEKIKEERVLLTVLEGRTCAFRKVLVEKISND